MNKIILVSGSSGMIGKALCLKLEEEGFEVRKLKRSSKGLSANEFFWNNVREAEIITGASIKMKEIVRNWLKENKMEYFEYVRKDSFLVNQ